MLKDKRVLILIETSSVQLLYGHVLSGMSSVTVKTSYLYTECINFDRSLFCAAVVWTRFVWNVVW